MTKNKVLLISTIVIVGLFALAAVFFKKEEKVEIFRINQDRLVKTYSPTLGDPNSKVTIVEFLDPECESCAAFNPTMKSVLNEYKGRVRFVVRYMLFHGNSKLAALATEAAGQQGKYWEMQEQLFSRHEWTHQQSPQNDKFEQMAQELGLDLEKFKKDMKDEKTLANIEADFQEGPAIGVNGTPTIFVNGRLLYELTSQKLKSLIEEELVL